MGVSACRGGSVRRRSSAAREEPPKSAEVVGEKLTDAEVVELGSVKLKVYVHYIRSIRPIMAVLTVLTNVCLQVRAKAAGPSLKREMCSC